jgi:hypothetical protein
MSTSPAPAPRFSLDNARPLLAIKVPPGDYTIDVTVAGKSERRPIRVEGAGGILNWHLPTRNADACRSALREESLRYAQDDMQRRGTASHFDVGIVNSAPFGVDAGQRCITDFWRV